MSLSGPVASLAIDPLGQGRKIGHLGNIPMLTGGNPGISVVAEHALVVDRTHRSLVVRAIITRVHRPVAALLRIPAERQLLQCVVVSQVQVRPGVVAGTKYVVHALLVHVGFLAVESCLPTALKPRTAPLDHLEETVRSRM